MDRPKKPKAENKVLAAVHRWLESVLVDERRTDMPAALTHAPRRWLVYEPMVLLPTGSFAAGPWPQLLATATDEQRAALWSGILGALASGSQRLTHLAVNEGIPLARDDGGGENVLRSPTGLRVLHGDFGPAQTPGAPTADDFARALWVTTRQNGIVQTWAPRWSMFSRGNIKEKARLLGWGEREQATSEARETSEARTERTEKWAVDLYAGIGYFVFSYARRGLRVVCWELNPWSAEALRRGAERNGWRVRMVGEEEATVVDETADITVFVEDNRHATRRLAEMAALRDGRALPVVHVNCGLLPRSRDSWRTAWQAAVDGSVDGETTAWLHLHENVGVDEVAGRRAEIEALLTTWTEEGCTAEVTHVEQVKTYAPGVWHCVFDVRVRVRVRVRRRGGGGV